MGGEGSEGRALLHYWVTIDPRNPEVWHILPITSIKWGEKRRFSAGSNFCTSENVSSFQLNLDLFLIKRARCILLPQKTGIASRMLKSQVPAHWGVMRAFLRAAHRRVCLHGGRGLHPTCVRAPLLTAITAGEA